MALHLLVAVMVVAVVAGGTWLARGWRAAGAEGATVRTLAVLPLENLSKIRRMTTSPTA